MAVAEVFPGFPNKTVTFLRDLKKNNDRDWFAARKEEYEADSHGVVILKRANYDGKQVMGNTLAWLMKTAGPSGGFFENHPGTDDRIQRIHDLP